MFFFFFLGSVDLRAIFTDTSTIVIQNKYSINQKFFFPNIVSEKYFILNADFEEITPEDYIQLLEKYIPSYFIQNSCINNLFNFDLLKLY